MRVVSQPVYMILYRETSLIQHSIGLEKSQIRRMLNDRVTLSILYNVIVPHRIVGLERISEYRAVGLQSDSQHTVP